LVGEPIEGSGGIALKSNLIDKNLNFFKTFSEHVQFIGTRIQLSAARQGVGADDTLAVYTVPANKISFLHTISTSVINRGGNTSRNSFMFIEGKTFFVFAAPATTAVNHMLVFNPFVFLRTGESVAIRNNSEDTNHEFNLSLMAYEINSETPL